MAADAGLRGDPSPTWMDELSFDPTVSWRRMGTRRLGREPWLIVDDRRDEELALRRRLLTSARSEVLVAPPGHEAAAEELLALAGAEGVAIAASPPAERQPALERWGRSIVEDVCLLARGEREWELVAGVLCFGSRWRLPDRIGRPLAEVHGPVPGYAEELADRVTQLLDRLGDHVVRRRNWFVHPDSSLHQPSAPAGGDPLIEGERCWSELVVRSERQTLRTLPATGRVAFTIRIQQATLAAVVADRGRRADLGHYLAEAPTADLVHRGMSPAQVEALLAVW